MPKVSVIVPVYKVEPYIEKCARSIMEQTLDDMEIIFVNDCSPDKSMLILQSIISDYPNRKNQIKIVNHEKNLGLHFARKTGVVESQGEYIIICDSDDWCELNMMEKMYNKGKFDDADIVVNNCFVEYPNCQNKSNFIPSGSPRECIRLLYEKNRFPVATWRNMVKRSVYSISFFDSIAPSRHGEDLFLMLQIYFHSNRISFVQDCLYHYNYTMNASMSRMYKRTKVELAAQRTNIQMICKMLDYEKSPIYRTACHCLMFGNKTGYRSAFENDREWFDYDKVCHKDILKFSNNSFANRIKLRLIFSNYFFWHLYDICQKKRSRQKNDS